MMGGSLGRMQLADVLIALGLVRNLARTLWFRRLWCDRNYYGAAVCWI